MQFLTNFKTLANGRFWAILAFLPLLPGCTSKPWEASFWTPPAATGAAPIKEGPEYPIRRATGEGLAWPELKDVPARPEPPSTEAERAAEIQQLEADRAAAEAAAGAAHE